MFGSTRPTVLRAVSLGVAGGFRAWSPPAALVLTHDEAPSTHGWGRWPVLRNKWVRWALIGVAAYEYVADKLPDTQSRLDLGVQLSHVDTGLVGRTAMTALAGAALGSEQGTKGATAAGAAFATVGALVGNFGGYSARKAVVESTGLPDGLVALVEDAVTVALLAAAVPGR